MEEKEYVRVEFIGPSTFFSDIDGFIIGEEYLLCDDPFQTFYKGRLYVHNKKRFRILESKKIKEKEPETLFPNII